MVFLCENSIILAENNINNGFEML